MPVEKLRLDLSQSANQQQQRGARHLLSEIAATVNDTDAALEALLSLLDGSNKPVQPDTLAHLLRPHLQRLRQAADRLNDLA